MRLRRLDFLAWGPFERASVPFDKESKLEVIYGPNERGKSSALRGVKALLFGIPQRTTDNHRFDYGSLRIGAQILSDQNELVEVVRRKALKKTLIRPDGTAFETDTLVPGYSEEEFEHIFGFDHETLRKSGEELTKGKGAYASTLWAATTGYLGAQRLLEALNDEAQAIFGPMKRSSEINKLLDEHHAALRHANENVATPEAWKSQVAALAELDTALAAIDVEEASLERGRRRTQFRLEVAELRARLSSLDEQLAPLVDIPVMTGAQHTRLSTAFDEHQGALRAAATVEARRTTIANELRDLGLPAPVLAQEQAVAALVAQRALAEDARRKAAPLEKQLEGMRKDEALLSEGLLPQLARAVPRVTQSVGSEAASLTDSIQSLSRERGALVAERGRLSAELAAASERAPDIDVATRAGLEEGPLVLVDGQALRELRARCVAEAARLDAHLSALGLADSAHLLVPPSKEETDQWVYDEQQRCAGNETLRRDETAASDALAEVTRLLVSLEQLVPAAVSCALETARAHRDAVWAQFRAGDANDGSFLEAAANVDNVVDEMLASSGALAEAKQLRRESAEKSKCLDGVRRALVKLDGEQRAFNTSLAGRFSAWAWAPSNAHDAAAWAGRLREADSERSLLGESTAAHGEVERTFASRWDRVARAAGFAEACDPSRASVLAEIAKKQLSLADQRAGERNEGEKRVEQARARVAEIERDLATLTQRDAEVGAGVTRLLSSLAVEMSNPLDVLREIPRAERLASLQASVAAVTHEHAQLCALVESFEHDVCALAQSLGLARKLESLDRAAADLRQEVAGETRRVYLRSKLDELSADQAAVTAKVAGLRSALDVALAEVGLRTEEAFVNVRDQVSKANVLRSQRDGDALALREKERLEPEFASEHFEDCISVGEQRAQLESTAARLTECRAKRDEVLSSRVGCELGLRRFDQPSRAADFSFDASAIAAGIGEQARQYARLRAAHLLLRVSLERNQKEHESPVLRRANAILSHLTHGAYEGLRVELGEKGEPELKAIARDHRARAAAELSEGTRNQMFLALKLASVEQSCRDRSPLPLVLDDVLVHFDDERSEATLETLAELSKSTQVLLFTHHRRVADFASSLHGARVHEL